VPTEKEQNGNQEEKQFDSPAPIEQTKNNTQSPNTKTNNIDNDKQPKFWSKFTISDVIQIFLLLATIAMLITFIDVSSNQYNNTIKALAKIDTTNTITRESLEFAKRTALASDSSTQHSLAVSDSSLVIAFKNLQLSEKKAKIELRAYLEIVSFNFKQFIVGKKIIFEAKLTNVGKTPAYGIKRKGATKIGGTGIYKSEIKDIKEYPGDESNLGTTLSHYHSINTEVFLTPSDSIKIINGDKFFAAWGEYAYQDVFGEVHFTPYSFRYIARDSKFYIYNIKDD